jgi:hypothetical protein
VSQPFAEHQRTGERRRRRYPGGNEVGLQACDRREALARYECRSVQLGDDRSTIGHLEAGDDPDPGLVEPGRDDWHGESDGHGRGERLGH